MGRRKIEIQPITHERNRSVTFLKRKNGLFKKAYELGVLCSVDVAVIIFEERPGHHVKLYQYCSGDVQDIVQRHIRYDGEKDTRFPHDFANNANSGKADDAADAEEEDAEEEEHESRSTVKKSSNPKLKQEYNNNGKAVVPPTPTDSNLGSVDVGDYSFHGLHRHAALPAPTLHPHSQLPSASTAPSLPISTERHTSSRLPLSTNGSATKLSGDEALLNSSYIPSPTSASSSGYRHNGQSLSYTPYLGSPASSLLGSSFDFPSSSAPRGGHVPISRDGLYSQRSSTYPPLHNHDPQGQLQSVYQQQQPHHPLIRHSLGQHSHSNLSQSPSQPSDLFPEMLDSADGHAHHSTHHRPLSSSSQLPHFTAMDWPTHGPATAAPRQTPPQEGGHQEPTAGQPPNNTSWLDFLSHGTSNSGHPLQLSLPSAERDYTNATSGMSGSEREAGVGIGGGGVGGGGLMMSPTSASRKRPRTTSCIEEGKRHSPLGIGLSTSASGRKKEEG